MCVNGFPTAPSVLSSASLVSLHVSCPVKSSWRSLYLKEGQSGDLERAFIMGSKYHQIVMALAWIYLIWVLELGALIIHWAKYYRRWRAGDGGLKGKRRHTKKSILHLLRRGLLMCLFIDTERPKPTALLPSPPLLMATQRYLRTILSLAHTVMLSLKHLCT